MRPLNATFKPQIVHLCAIADPLELIDRLAKRDSPREGSGEASPALDEHAEHLARERSIRSNRRQKFISCVVGDDVNMGACHRRYIPIGMVRLTVAMQRSSADFRGTASLETYGL